MSNEEAINIVNEMTYGDDSVSSVARQLVCIDILGLDVIEWAKTPIENLVSESSHEALSPAIDTYIDNVTADKSSYTKAQVIKALIEMKWKMIESADVLARYATIHERISKEISG